MAIRYGNISSCCNFLLSPQTDIDKIEGYLMAMFVRQPDTPLPMESELLYDPWGRCDLALEPLRLLAEIHKRIWEW